jgi:hypothetical protein
LQVNLPAAAQGDLTTLMLAVKNVTLPGLTVGKGSIPFLAGWAHYATKLEDPGDITITIHDYVDVHKTTGTLVLFGPDGTFTREWRLIGLFPMTIEPPRTLDYDANEAVQLEYTFAVDTYQFQGAGG